MRTGVCRFRILKEVAITNPRRTKKGDSSVQKHDKRKSEAPGAEGTEQAKGERGKQESD